MGKELNKAIEEYKELQGLSKKEVISKLEDYNNIGNYGEYKSICVEFEGHKLSNMISYYDDDGNIIDRINTDNYIKCDKCNNYYHSDFIWEEENYVYICDDCKEGARR